MKTQRDAGTSPRALHSHPWRTCRWDRLSPYSDRASPSPRKGCCGWREEGAGRQAGFLASPPPPLTKGSSSAIAEPSCEVWAPGRAPATAREEGMRLAVRETGRGRQKKAINPINPNLEALPAPLKYRELGWV